MAVDFSPTNDYFTISDHANLTLPDGNWFVAIWTKITNNAGTLYQYLVSNKAVSANGNLNLYLFEESQGVNPNKWAFVFIDDDGTDSGNVISSTAPGADGLWRLIVVQRDTSAAELQMWFCELNGTANKVASVADTNFNAGNGDAWNIGRRADGDANRYYDNIACEFAKGNVALSQAQIEAIATGQRIDTVVSSPVVYLPMFISEAVIYDESGNGHNATRSGSPLSATHVYTPPDKNSRATLTVNTVERAGFNLTDAAFTTLQAGLSNAAKVTYHPANLIALKNTGSSAATFTLKVRQPTDLYSSPIPDETVVVPAGKTYLYPSLPIFKMVDGKMYIECDVAGQVLVAKASE